MLQCYLRHPKREKSNKSSPERLQDIFCEIRVINSTVLVSMQCIDAMATYVTHCVYRYLAFTTCSLWKTLLLDKFKSENIKQYNNNSMIFWGKHQQLFATKITTVKLLISNNMQITQLFFFFSNLPFSPSSSTKFVPRSWFSRKLQSSVKLNCSNF